MKDYLKFVLHVICVSECFVFSLVFGFACIECEFLFGSESLSLLFCFLFFVCTALHLRLFLKLILDLIKLEEHEKPFTVSR